MMIQLLEQFNLRTLNTFSVNSIARYFFELTDLASLAALTQHPYFQCQQWFILGGGSNVLLPSYLDKLVIKPNLFGKKILSENNGTITLQVGAGEVWHDFVHYCLANQYFGLENLVLIPGTVGAAPIQNIGAYGVEVGQFIESVQVYDSQAKKIVTLNNHQCEFSYRNSRFKQTDKHRFIVLSVCFRLHKSPKLVASYPEVKQCFVKLSPAQQTAKKLADIIINLRQQKLPDPTISPNAGSFFKNPIVSNEKLQQLKKTYPTIPSHPLGNTNAKLSAAWLIEQCGLKGLTHDGAEVSSQHALVLVNKSQATSLAIKQLADIVKQRVAKQFAIDLNEEVIIIV